MNFHLLLLSYGIIIQQSDVAGEVLKLLFSDGGKTPLRLHFIENFLHNFGFLHIKPWNLFYFMPWLFK